MVDGAPEIKELAIDLHKHLVQMPPLRIGSHLHDPPLSDLGGEYRPKPVPPKPDGLVADVDPTLGQKILDVAQRQRVSDVHHHDPDGRLWRAVEISERVTHVLKLARPQAAPEFALTEPSLGLSADATRRAEHSIFAIAQFPTFSKISMYCGRSRPRRWTPQLGGKRAYEGSGRTGVRAEAAI